MNDLASLQSRLGHEFQNPALLTQAVTHRSRGESNNERLEHLGDGILGFVIADALFARFPEAAEGELSAMRSSLVRNQALAEAARGLALQPCLRVGKSVLSQSPPGQSPVGKSLPRSRQNHGNLDSILAGAFEAIIGAIYLDSDLPTAKAALLKLFAQRLDAISPRNLKDDKTRLQEYLQKHALPLPVYVVTDASGKDHAPVFTVACKVMTHAGEPADKVSSELAEPVVAATASGESKRAAEQNAAAKALALLHHV